MNKPKPPPLPPADLPTPDVALFVDWENFKYSLYEVSRKPDIPALMQAVRQRCGRPVIARAYADWQDYYHRRSYDQMTLYHAGIEPVYVPAKRSPVGPERIKNSVDIKMSLDCLEVAYAEPQIQTFVLVAGDADFLHIAAALRRRGSRVVMIGVSGSTSGRLAGLVDEMIFYDEVVEQEDNEQDKPPEAKYEAKAGAPEITLEQARDLLMRGLRQRRESEGGRHYPPVLSWLGLHLREQAPRFSLEKHGFERIQEFVAQMQEAGLLRIETQGRVERVWLPEDAAQIEQPASVSKPTPISPALAALQNEPDDITSEQRDDFADILLTADDIENSGRDYMARSLLARFLYNKGHWDPADLPPQAAAPRSNAWGQRELPEIHALINSALDQGVLLQSAYVDPHSGSEIPTLEINDAHPFARKVFAETAIRR